MKRPLRELSRGDVFRAADGRLWVRHRGDGALTLDGNHAYCLPLGGGLAAAHGLDALVEPLDLPALLSRVEALGRENDYLRGQLSDLWQDRTGAVGVEAERGAMVAYLRGEAAKWREGAEGDGAIDVSTRERWAAYSDAFADAANKVTARGPWRPPVPPHRLDGSLREVLAKLLEWQWWSGGPLPLSDLRALVSRVREALGED